MAITLMKAINNTEMKLRISLESDLFITVKIPQDAVSLADGIGELERRILDAVSRSIETRKAVIKEASRLR